MSTDLWRGGHPPGARLALLACLFGCVGLLASGCGGPRTATGAPPLTSPLENTFPSIEALGTAVLEGFARRDFDALERLRLTEAEFTTVIWPRLPASAGGSAFARDYAWRDLAQKSRLHLRQSLAEHGGRRRSLVRVEFAGQTTTHDAFAVHRHSRLLVRDENGQTAALELFGSVVESGGRFKVYSFVVD